MPYKMDDGEEDKKCKGVKKVLVKKKISFEDCKKCLFSEKEQYRTMNTFRSRKHDIYTASVTKVALSSVDDKRVVCEDSVNTLAIGHWRTLGKN